MTDDPHPYDPTRPGPPREVAEDAAAKENVMFQWAIYERPKDFPNSYVARKWRIAKGYCRPCEIMIVGPDLESVRQLLPMWLTRIPRQTGDDPVIVEVWI